MYLNEKQRIASPPPLFRFILIYFLCSWVPWGIAIALTALQIIHTQNFLFFLLYYAGGCLPFFGTWLYLRSGSNNLDLWEFFRATFQFFTHASDYALAAFLFFFHFSVVIVAPYLSPSLGILLNYNGKYLRGIFMFPLVLLICGLREAGWRGALQPRLHKKLPFPLAVVCTAVFWFLNDLPLVLLQFLTGYDSVFLPVAYLNDALSIPASVALMGLQLLGLSFLMGVLLYVTDSIFLCIGLNTCIQAWVNVFAFRNATAQIIAYVADIVISIFLWLLVRRIRANIEAKMREEWKDQQFLTYPSNKGERL